MARLYFYLMLPRNVDLENGINNFPFFKSISGPVAGGQIVTFARNEIDIECFMMQVASNFLVPGFPSTAGNNRWNLWHVGLMDPNDWTLAPKLFRMIGRRVRNHGLTAQNEWRMLMPITEKKFRASYPTIDWAANVFMGDNAQRARKINYDPQDADIDNDVEIDEDTVFNTP